MESTRDVLLVAVDIICIKVCGVYLVATTTQVVVVVVSAWEEYLLVLLARLIIQ